MFNSQLTHEELEDLARREPADYKAHIQRLALLGYLYIAFGGLVLLGAVAAIVWASLAIHIMVAVKFALIPLIALLAVVKSLHVKFDKPKGVRLSRSDAPLLFEMIDEIRSKVQCPKINAVLLDAEYNCSAVRIPKLGLLGFDETYVTLGLPFLDSVSIDQFKWALGHELGHLANLDDGRLSSWVYQVQLTWAQMYHHMSEQSSLIGGIIFAPFANWYFPLLTSHSLVLRRAHELAADDFAARLVAPAAGIEALLVMSTRGSAVYRIHYENALKKIHEHPEPPPNFFSSLRDEMKAAFPQEKALQELRLSMIKHDEFDSHPSLPERVKALGGQDDIEILLSKFGELPPLNRTAAEVLFGSQLPRLNQELTKFWQASVKEIWQTEYQSRAWKQRDLASYGADVSSLPNADRLEYARLLIEVEGDERAIEHAREFLKEKEDGELHFHVGRLLLDKGDEAGIYHLQRALELEPVSTGGISQLLQEYYKRTGNESEAEANKQRVRKFEEDLEKALAEFKPPSADDNVERHDYTERRLNRLREVLYKASSIGDAWLVSRPVPAILGGTQNLLIIKSNRNFALDDPDLYGDVPVHAPELQEVALLLYTQTHGLLITKILETPNSHIYNRKEWEKSRATNPNLQIAPQPSAASDPQAARVAVLNATPSGGGHLKMILMSLAAIFLVAGGMLVWFVWSDDGALTTVSKPVLPVLFSDDSLRDRLLESRPAFEKLTKMLPEDPGIRSVGTHNLLFGESNEFKPLDQALTETGISEKRYGEYLALLNETGAISVGPGPAGSTIFLMYKEATRVWAIGYFPEEVPGVYMQVADTNKATAGPDGKINVVSPIILHWYVLRLQTDR